MIPTRSHSWFPQYVRSTVTRRRFLRGAAYGVGAGVLIACGGGDVGTLKLDDAGIARQPGTVWFTKNDWKLADETKQAVRGGIYRGYMKDDQTGHFDAIMLMSSQIPFAPHVYEMLLARNKGPSIEPGSTAANTPVGTLAESWEFSDSGTTVTFTMRQGVKFHNIQPVNGRVMDIDDWKTSQKRHLEAGVYRTILGDILDKVEFPDANHMVWKLKFPYSPLMGRIWNDKFAYPIQPKELNTDPRLAESTAIGTGYKILDKHQPAITMEYRKHSEYWGGDPFIDRWHAPIIPEYANQYAQFLSRNIIDFTPEAREVLRLHRDSPESIMIAEEPPDDYASRYRFGQISPKEQVWSDPRVRVAIRRSIDFKGIAEFLSDRAAFEAAGIPVEILPMTHVAQNPSFWLNPEKGELGKFSENYLYNVAEAKKLTAAAGFDGPIELPYFIRLQRGDITELETLVKDSLIRAGTFKLKVELIPAAEWNNYVIEGRFDGVLGTTNAGAHDPDHYLGQEYHSTISRPKAYTDPRIDALVEAQRKAFDVEERWDLIRKVQLVLAEFMPVIPTGHQYTTFGFRWPWVHNINRGEVGSPPAGRPALGGHLQWLDSEMPNRDKTV